MLPVELLEENECLANRV